MLLTWRLTHQAGFVWVSFSFSVSKCDHLWLQFAQQFLLYSGSFFLSQFWTLNQNNIQKTFHVPNELCLFWLTLCIWTWTVPSFFRMDQSIWIQDPWSYSITKLLNWNLGCFVFEHLYPLVFVLFCFSLHDLL